MNSPVPIFILALDLTENTPHLSFFWIKITINLLRNYFALDFPSYKKFAKKQSTQ